MVQDSPWSLSSEFQQVIEAMPDAVIILGNDGRIWMINRKTEAMFGYTRDELLEQPLSKLLPRRFQSQHEGLVNEYFALPRLRPMGSGLDLVAKRKAGQEFPVEVCLSPLLVNGEARYAMSSIRDITERKRMEDALRDGERIKDEFITTLAHELRTPLAALRGFVDTLLLQTSRGNGPTLANWQTDALSEIGQASYRLQMLSSVLLDVTRLHAGLLEIQQEPHDLAALVRRVAGHLQKSTRLHRLQVRGTSAPQIVNIDAARLEQVLVQLLTNAITYSPDGGSITITLSPHARERRVKLQVRDQGIGIPRSQQRKLFTPFCRIETPVSLGGLGLGLYLSERLVKQHGGEIGVKSSPGKGSAFWLTLPLLSEEQASAY
ncbi:MAG: ATP-binding protein [Ktedonobacterales bacterium]